MFIKDILINYLWGEMLEYIKLMFLSMVPVIELRGAIPLGIAAGLNPVYLYITCLIGSSIVAVPIVFLFKKIIEYLRHRKYFNKIIRWIDKKLEVRAKKLKTVSIVGIIIFVGVPLPTTGSWSAAALASILNMRVKYALLGIFVGNSIAGLIVSIVSLHLAGNMNLSISKIVIFSVAILAIFCIFSSKEKIQKILKNIKLLKKVKTISK